MKFLYHFHRMLNMEIRKKTERKTARTIPVDLIAPCGMNCRLCWGFIRDKNTCPGCRNIDHQYSREPKTRSGCIIRNCEPIALGRLKHCSDRCDRFPCSRLKNLDKRYRTRYGMSMIENLNLIAEQGIGEFIRKEKEKWTCPLCGGMICVHRPACLSCGYEWH